MGALFRDRTEAGKALAEELRPYAPPDTIVVAVADGGVPVGEAVADRLGLALDVVMVERVRIAGLPDLDAGALVSGGARALNVEHLRALGVADELLERAIAEADRRLAASTIELGDHHQPATWRRRRVLIVDDGMASGITMRAGVRGLRLLGATTIVAGVAVAAPEALDTLWGTGAHRAVCCAAPFAFTDVASCYADYEPVPRAAALEALRRHGRARHAAAS